MVIEYRNKSLADRVFETLEMKILTGEYQRGEVLTEKKVSEEIGVSRTPIREALKRLADEDLIEPGSHGNVVRGITKEDAEDSYRVKRTLEIEVIKQAAENVTDELIALMRENIEQQEFYAKKNDAKKVSELDTEFHDMIYVASGSRLMKLILQQVHRKIMRYRRGSIESSNSRLVSSTKEHKAIFEAIAARDVDAAGKAARIHIDHAYDNIKKLMDSRDF